MPNLYDGRELFLRHLENRRRAKGYIRAAEDRITEVIVWLEANTTIRATTELGSDSLEAFVSEKYAHLADGTFNLYIGHIRRWIEYLAEEGKAPIRAARRLTPREHPLPKREQQFIHEDRALALAASGRLSHVRDEYYIKIAYYLQRRWSELSKMQVGDVDLQSGPAREFGCYSYVNVKGRKSATLPLSHKAAQVIKEWLEIYEQEIGRPLKAADYLIPALKNGDGRTYRGMRKNRRLMPTCSLPYSSASSLLRGASEKAGWDEMAKGHGLRRGSLHDLLKDTGDIRLVQTSAGHASQRTTEVYVNRPAEIEDLGRALSDLAKREQGVSSTPVEPDNDGDGVVVSLFERRTARNRA